MSQVFKEAVVVGAGAMGQGIAQVLAQSGVSVKLYDTRAEALTAAQASLAKIMNRLVDKGRVTPEDAAATLGRVKSIDNLKDAAAADLVIEAIEEADPKGRSFPKFAEEDAFYANDAPDAPDLKLGKRKNLDDLMTASGKEFTGSFGRDEFDEFKARMSAEFMRESHEAVEAGDHHHSQELGGDHRVFGDAEDELSKVKSEIAEESGLSDPSAGEDDEDYYVDEDGCEWWKDDDGYWWYRPAGDEDWHPYEE